MASDSYSQPRPRAVSFSCILGKWANEILPRFNWVPACTRLPTGLRPQLVLFPAQAQLREHSWSSRSGLWSSWPCCKSFILTSKTFSLFVTPTFSKSTLLHNSVSFLPSSLHGITSHSFYAPTLASPPQALICWTTGFLMFLLAQKWSAQTDILLMCTQVKQIVMDFLVVWMCTLGMATQSRSLAHTRWPSGWEISTLAYSTSSDEHRA